VIYFPDTMHTQMFVLGDTVNGIVFINVPFNPTSYAGYKIEAAVTAALTTARATVIAAPCNGYRGYVTTEEEYIHQRFEGAATVYGRKTLSKVITKLTAQTQCVQLATGGCAVPVDRLEDGTCPNGDNCYPIVPPNPLTKLNTMAQFVTKLLDNEKNGDGTAYTTSDIKDVGKYIIGSLEQVSNYSAIQASFWSSGQYGADTMAMKQMAVLCYDAGAWVEVFTEADPETEITLSCAGRCTTRVRWYISSTFNKVKYANCKIVNWTFLYMLSSDGKTTTSKPYKYESPVFSTTITPPVEARILEITDITV